MTALVATIWWRVSGLRTKKTSRIGPATPAVSVSAVTTKPQTGATKGFVMSRPQRAGIAKAMKGIAPSTSSTVASSGTKLTIMKSASAAAAPAMLVATSGQTMSRRLMTAR